MNFRKFAFCLLAASGLVVSAAAQDIVSTVVGGGPNGIPGVNANVNAPYTIAVDASNNVYFAASAQHRIFEISTSGVITVIAGTGAQGYSGDGGLAVNADLNTPWGVAVDKATPANVYIGDTANCLVRKVTRSTGIITTIAGLVTVPTTGNPYTSCGYSGDNGAANKAELYYPSGVAVNTNTGDVYVAEFYNGVVRKITGGFATGEITVVAGSGGSTTTGNNCGGTSPYGDGGAATSGYLCYPQALALDISTSPANVFVSESSSGGRCDVREVVGATGKLYQVAGDFSCGFSGDSGSATSAQLNDPWQPHLSVSGSTTTLQIADYANARVRQWTLTYSSNVPVPGTITTIAGKGEGGFCGDAGPSLSACMNPVGIGYDSSSNLYIGDYGSDRVREVAKGGGTPGYINTIAGWGPSGGTNTTYSDPVGLKGIGGTPSLYYPTGVFADPTSSNVYVGGYDGQAVYLWNSSNNEITDFAGDGVAGFAGDGTAASGAGTELDNPWGIARDSSGDIYIADYNNCLIREVNHSTGDIHTVVGGSDGHDNGCGYSGDGGTAVNAQIYNPSGVAVDGANNLYIAELNECIIRKVAAGTNIVSTIVGGSSDVANGCGFFGDGGPGNKAKINEPYGIALDGAGNLYIADAYNQRIRELVEATGKIETLAGTSTAGYDGDGTATAYNLYYPQGVYSDVNGNVFISDTDDQILRWVTPTGTMITFGGTEESAGFSGDGGSALAAQFYYPEGVSQDSGGNFYVADQYNYRVRRITPFAGYGLSSANVSFETQPAGTISDFQPVTVSAVGPTTFSNVAVSGSFSEIDDCTGQSLTAGQTCEVDVYFQPSSAGRATGTLTVSSNALFALNPNTVALSGTSSGLSLSGSLSFGDEPLKTPLVKTVTLTNSGVTTTLKKIYLTETVDFSISGGSCPTGGGSLSGGSSCTIDVSFSPQTVNFKKGTLVVLSTDPASPLLAGASGIGTEVKTSASSISFGSISYGTNKTSDLTISNTGTATFTLAPTISGTGFSISNTGKTCGSSVAAGASCVLPVEYDPTAVGSNTGSLTLTTNGGSSPVIPLTGTATSDVSVSPTSLSFGTIAHGTTKTLNVTVSNVGTIASLSVGTALGGTNPTDFTVLSTGNTCTSGVAPGKSCTLPVEFKPAAAASYSGTLTVNTNGGANPVVTLTGTGS